MSDLDRAWLIPPSVSAVRELETEVERLRAALLWIAQGKASSPKAHAQAVLDA